MIQFLLHCFRLFPGTGIYNLIHFLLFPRMGTVIRLAASNSGYLVDAGCGTGIYSILIAKKNPNLTVIGVDVQAMRCACAQRIAQSLALYNVHFITADVFTHQLPYAQTYLLCDILCYHPLGDQNILLRNIADHLPPKGQIIIKDHAKDSHWRTKLLRIEESWGRKIRQWLHTERRPHYYQNREFLRTKKERKLELEEIGLCVRIVPLLGSSLLPHTLYVAEKQIPKTGSQNAV
ncbi:MAG: class I SAM-dependent methyltransferase [Thermodesulfobacteriota bacterium]|nr:class I SAM-dependent methyltransferase [Thermodesulfobacteriota bacterium]